MDTKRWMNGMFFLIIILFSNIKTNSWFHDLAEKVDRHLWRQTDMNFRLVWNKCRVLCETGANLHVSITQKNVYKVTTNYKHNVRFMFSDIAV